MELVGVAAVVGLAFIVAVVGLVVVLGGLLVVAVVGSFIAVVGVALVVAVLRLAVFWLVDRHRPVIVLRRLGHVCAVELIAAGRRCIIAVVGVALVVAVVRGIVALRLETARFEPGQRPRTPLRRGLGAFHRRRRS